LSESCSLTDGMIKEEDKNCFISLKKVGLSNVSEETKECGIRVAMKGANAEGVISFTLTVTEPKKVSVVV
jgi:hypothetical protein